MLRRAPAPSPAAYGAMGIAHVRHVCVLEARTSPGSRFPGIGIGHVHVYTCILSLRPSESRDIDTYRPIRALFASAKADPRERLPSETAWASGVSYGVELNWHHPAGTHGPRGVVGAGHRHCASPRVPVRQSERGSLAKLLWGGAVI